MARFRLTVACLAALAACATPRERAPATPAAAAAEAAPPSAPPARKGAADASLTSAEYVAAGFPAPDRTWTPPDYAAAHAALAKLVADRGGSVLPRFGSPRSGPAFARLVDRGNFAMSEGSGPFAIRLTALMEGMKALPKIVNLYLESALKLGHMDPELLELTCVALHGSRRMADLAFEAPPPDAGAPRRAMYDEGVRKVQSGMANGINGTLISLSDRAASPDARARFAACLADEIPRALPHVTADMRAEIVQKIRRAAADEPKGTPASPEIERLARAVSAGR